MFIDWEKRAKERNWCAVELWNKSMRESFINPKQDELTIKEVHARMKRREQALKTRDALLEKNPNHFKELRAKRFENRGSNGN